MSTRQGKSKTRAPFDKNHTIEGETFEWSPCLGKLFNKDYGYIMLSTKGRAYLRSSDQITRGYNKGGKRRALLIDGKIYSMSRLIFMAFYNREPVGRIRHNPKLPDSVLLDEDGFYLNYPEHLEDSSGETLAYVVCLNGANVTVSNKQSPSEPPQKKQKNKNVSEAPSQTKK